MASEEASELFKMRLRDLSIDQGDDQERIFAIISQLLNDNETQTLYIPTPTRTYRM